MYAIQEENKDLKDELQKLKSFSYDQKVKKMNEENQRLRRRNGQLLVEMEEMKI